MEEMMNMYQKLGIDQEVLAFGKSQSLDMRMKKSWIIC